MVREGETSTKGEPKLGWSEPNFRFERLRDSEFSHFFVQVCVTFQGSFNWLKCLVSAPYGSVIWINVPGGGYHWSV